MAAITPESFPSLTRAQIGHGTTVDGEGVGQGVWMKLTASDGQEFRVSMPPERASQVIEMLQDSLAKSVT